MVEGAPVWLKKEVKKEEAEKLVEKLKGLGAECRLAWYYFLALFNLKIYFSLHLRIKSFS